MTGAEEQRMPKPQDNALLAFVKDLIRQKSEAGEKALRAADERRAERIAAAGSRPVTSHKGTDMQWWGHSREHGWVVLDRRIPCNVPGIKTDLLFLRCKDATIFGAKRESWNPPSYRFAPNYLRDLASPASDEAAAELEGFKLQWPEFERELQRECRETEERAEAVRLREEKARKQAAAELKKQASAPMA